MDLVRVEPDDDVRVRAATALLETARRTDDPQAIDVRAREIRNDLRYGYDLNPPQLFALEPAGPADPVGLLKVHAPVHDNRNLLLGEITVAPQCRRQGHGRRLMAGLVALAGQRGRSTLWAGAAQDDPAGPAFLLGQGFAAASHDARRHQVLARVDWAEIDRLEALAAERTGDYALGRLRPPHDDPVLQALVEVTAAINDAPMGTLDYEEEVFDLSRLRDAQTAWQLRGSDVYRVVARHRGTDAIAGHSYLVIDPEQPEVAYQGDTAVARSHRGHRLGLALKIAMLRWLAEAAPQVALVETWNNVDNTFMIGVNEALGYRLSRTFTTYQRLLAPFG
jgi:GNAT superfamily N-acetyltransferase